MRKKDKNYNRFKETSNNRFEIKNSSTFKTHNDKDVDLNFSSLLGYLETTYKNLVRNFGEPILNYSDKSDATWEIEFGDGEIASIYCWKNYGIEPVEEIKDWHIGGFNKDVIQRIFKILTV